MIVSPRISENYCVYHKERTMDADNNKLRSCFGGEMAVKLRRWGW